MVAVVHAAVYSAIQTLSPVEEVEDLQLQPACSPHEASLEAYSNRLDALRMDVVTDMEALGDVNSLVS